MIDAVRLKRQKHDVAWREVTRTRRFVMRWSWRHWQRICQRYEPRWTALHTDRLNSTELSRICRPRNLVHFLHISVIV